MKMVQLFFIRIFILHHKFPILCFLHLQVLVPPLCATLFCLLSLWVVSFILFSRSLQWSKQGREPSTNIIFSCLLCLEIQFPPYFFLPILNVPLATMEAVLDCMCVTLYNLFQVKLRLSWHLGFLQADRPTSFRASLPFWCLPHPQQGTPLHALSLLQNWWALSLLVLWW